MVEIRGFIPLIPGFIIVFVIAFLLRITGYDFGLPWHCHPDEFRHALNLHQFYTNGSLIPVSWTYPPLMPEIAVLLHIFHPESILRSGRIITVILGSLTPVFGGAAVTVLSGRVPGFLAALLIAVSPLHIEQSRYFTSDVPLTCALTAVLLLTALAMQKNRLSYLYMAAVASAAGAMFKQNGLILIAVPMAGAWLPNDVSIRRKVKLTTAIFCIFLISIPVLAPGILFQPGSVYFMYTHQYEIYRNMHHPGHFSDQVLQDGLVILATLILGPAGLIVAAAGAIRSLSDRSRLRMMLPAFLILGLSFAAILRVHLVFARNFLWTLPGFVLLLGMGVQWVQEAIKSKLATKILVAGLGCAIILPPAALGLYDTTLITHRDTRLQAMDWLNTHVSDKSKVVVSPDTLDVYLPTEYRETDGIKVLSWRAPFQYRLSGVRFVIVSYGSFNRYFKAPHRFPEDDATWRRRLALMESESESKVVFEAPHSISGRLFGTTADVYHHPTIHIYDLGQETNDR